MTFAREPTNPSMRVVVQPTRQLREPPSAWRQLAMVAGVVATVVAALGAVASFLKPSIVASFELESSQHADAEHKRLDARIDSMLLGIDSKLDILIKRKK